MFNAQELESDGERKIRYTERKRRYIDTYLDRRRRERERERKRERGRESQRYR